MRSIHSFGRSRRAASISNVKGRKRRLKLYCSAKNTATATAASRTTSAAMHKRLRNLQRIVPAGTHETDLNHLFQRTADYIFALQAKLNILKDLTSFYGV